MKKIHYLIAMFCMVLIVTTPIVIAQLQSQYQQQYPNQFQNQQFNQHNQYSQYSQYNRYNQQNQNMNQLQFQPSTTSQFHNQYQGPFYSNPNPFNNLASSHNDPRLGSNLGGYTYNNPYQDYVRRHTGGYGYADEQYIGEAIIVNVANYEPKQIRQSHLEQQDVPVYIYLKGTTMGTALSPFATGDNAGTPGRQALGPIQAQDPLTGISQIPPIDYIDVQPNITSNYSNYIRFVNYIPPRRERVSLDNLGYLIAYIRKIENENSTPPDNTIVMDLNAKIYLRLEDSGLLGVSQQDLVLKQFQNVTRFIEQKDQYSFFSNKGYLMATRVGTDSVTLQVFNKDMHPIALHTQTPSSMTTGMQTHAVLSLRKGETSMPLSFQYSGNPFTDLFRVKLEDVSFPADKAEITYQLNGRKVTRKVPIEGRLHPGSNWVLKSVNKTLPNLPPRVIDNSNLNEITGLYNLNDRQLNQIRAMIGSDQKPMEEHHRIEIENQFTGVRKTIVTHLITREGEKIDFDYELIGQDTADYLVTKYCDGEFIPKKDTDGHDDFACQAIKRYLTIIKDYPTTSEATKAKRDLADIFADYLIEYKLCKQKPDGTAQDPAKCKEFQRDMNDLALYYYSLVGERDKILYKLGRTGGDDYLDDEGISIQLQRVITLQEEQPKAFLRLHTGAGQYLDFDKPFELGNEISLDEHGKPTIINGYQNDQTGKYVWRIDTVNPSSASMRLYKIEGTGNTKKYTGTQKITTLALNQRATIQKTFPKVDPQGRQMTTPEVVEMELINVDSRYEAYVSVLPGGGRAYTTSNFRVNVPIDPRPFKLTPDQLKYQINKTRDIIEKLDTVIEKLDKFITTMKKTCLAVFAILTIKNSFTGTRNIARRQVSEHFKLRCEQEMREGETDNHPRFRTMDRCLAHYSSEIKKSTDGTEKHIDKINKKLKGKNVDDLMGESLPGSAQERADCGEFNEFRQASVGVNNQETIRQYRDCLLFSKIKNDDSLSGEYNTYATEKLVDLGGQDRIILYQQAKNLASTNEGWDENNPEDIQKIVLQLQEGQNQQMANVNMLHTVKLSEDASAGEWRGTAFITNPHSTDPSTALTAVPIKGLSKYEHMTVMEGKNSAEVDKTICQQHLSGTTWDDSANTCKRNNRPIMDELYARSTQLREQPHHQQGTIYQTYVDERIYHRMTMAGTAVGTIPEDLCPQIGGNWESGKCKPKIYTHSSIKDTTGRSINTAYSYGTSLIAQYDSNALPYCYPTGKGEYALVLERFQGNKGIKTVRIMNVGPNGRIDCGGGDDIIATGGDETALQVNPSKKSRYIQIGERLGKCNNEGDIVGSIDNKPVKCTMQNLDTSNSLIKPKCIDVMDPMDCKIMFNFCDPVMCPSSRCTLGGLVPERNVIQSGISGSLLLCLPNIKEGVYIPVCLTGISAGLKNIRSILEGYASCLEINLKQGKNVGFCDYIRSVGICEMIWRETYNLIDIGGRGIIDWASGKVFGEPTGGGEYLSFKSSLDNVGNSVQVFTEEYKSTYTAQFMSQSTSEIGTQICRLSVNGKLPSVGKILDQITQPEDPPQFTAFFDAVPHASPGETFGVPGVPMGTQEMSLYKAFYHIYAGTGFYQGSFSQPQSLFAPDTQLGPAQPIVYSVYLINREMGYQPLYMTYPGDFAQMQGRLEEGRYAQETVQKVGRKDYNQICVNINGIEECGFGRVSSSFGLGELNDALTKSEAEENINSSAECTPDAQTSPEYSAAKLGALGAAQFLPGAGAAMGSGLITSNIDQNLMSRGIVRVCSVGEPTQELGRWKMVGSCGEENGIPRGTCWLDIKSVKITNSRYREDLMQELAQRADGSINIIDGEVALASLNSLNEERDNIIDSIRSLVAKAKAGKALGPTTPIIEPDPSGAAQGSIAVKTKFNVRSSPYEVPGGGNIIGLADPAIKNKFEYYEAVKNSRGEDWARIKFNGKDGWIYVGGTAAVFM